MDVQAGYGFFKLKSNEDETINVRFIANIGVEVGHSNGRDTNFYLLPAEEEEPGSARAGSIRAYFVSVQETPEGDEQTIFPASNAMFGPPGGGPLRAPLVIGTPPRACSALKNTGPGVQNRYDGRVVVLLRGRCSFVTKVYEAQLAGASGVIVVNDRAGELFMMVSDA